MSGLRRTVRITFRLVACLAIIPLGLEAWLRWTGYDPLPGPAGPRHLFQADAELGVSLRPAFRGTHHHPEFSVPIAINSHGCRDQESAAKAPGTFRILSLGDSFAYGYGVRIEETYGRELARLLAADGRQYETLNAAAPGFGQREMVQMLVRHQGWYRPDLVLATFFFANDLTDNVDPRPTERGGMVMKAESAAVLDALPRFRFAAEHSDLLLVAQILWLRIQHGVALPAAADPRAPGRTAIGAELLRRDPDGERERQWQAMATWCERLAEAARAANVPVVLINIPMEYQCDARLWSELCEQGGIRAADHDLTLPAERAAKVCAGSGIHFLDLTPAFAADPDRRAGFFPQNLHWTPQGHRLVARQLASFLRARHLVP